MLSSITVVIWHINIFVSKSSHLCAQLQSKSAFFSLICWTISFLVKVCCFRKSVKFLQNQSKGKQSRSVTYLLLPRVSTNYSAFLNVLIWLEIASGDVQAMNSTVAAKQPEPAGNLFSTIATNFKDFKDPGRKANVTTQAGDKRRRRKNK